MARKTAHRTRTHTHCPAAVELPVPHYDTLTTTQVAAATQHLAREGLQAVLRYEQARKNRRTVIAVVQRRMNRGWSAAPRQLWPTVTVLHARWAVATMMMMMMMMSIRPKRGWVDVGQGDRTGVLLPRVTRETTATPQQVWDVLCDGWLLGSWMVGASRVRAVDVGWPQPLARIHHSIGSWPTATQVTALCPSQQLVLQARGWSFGTTIISITVNPARGGSRVAMETSRSDHAHVLPRSVRWTPVDARDRESLRRLTLLAQRRTR